MSYRPPGEDLDEVVDNLLNGLSSDNIDEFRKVVRRREDTLFDAYSKEHIQDLYSLLEYLEYVRRKLKDIK